MTRTGRLRQERGLLFQALGPYETVGISRTSTGTEEFSMFLPDATKFVLLRVFTLTETIHDNRFAQNLGNTTAQE